MSNITDISNDSLGEVTNFFEDTLDFLCFQSVCKDFYYSTQNPNIICCSNTIFRMKSIPSHICPFVRILCVEELHEMDFLTVKEVVSMLSRFPNLATMDLRSRFVGRSINNTCADLPTKNCFLSLKHLEISNSDFGNRYGLFINILDTFKNLESLHFKCNTIKIISEDPSNSSDNNTEVVELNEHGIESYQPVSNEIESSSSYRQISHSKLKTLTIDSYYQRGLFSLISDENQNFPKLESLLIHQDSDLAGLCRLFKTNPLSTNNILRKLVIGESKRCIEEKLSLENFKDILRHFPLVSELSITKITDFEGKEDYYIDSEYLSHITLRNMDLSFHQLFWIVSSFYKTLVKLQCKSDGTNSWYFQDSQQLPFNLELYEFNNLFESIFPKCIHLRELIFTNSRTLPLSSILWMCRRKYTPNLAKLKYVGLKSSYGSGMMREDASKYPDLTVRSFLSQLPENLEDFYVSDSNLECRSRMDYFRNFLLHSIFHLSKSAKRLVMGKGGIDSQTLLEFDTKSLKKKTSELRTLKLLEIDLRKECLPFLLDNIRELESVSLVKCNVLISIDFEKSLSSEAYHNLRRISFRRIPIWEGNLSVFLSPQHFPNVTHLIFFECDIFSCSEKKLSRGVSLFHHPNDEDFTCISRSKLEVLAMKSMKGNAIDTKDFVYILNHLKELKVLKVSGMSIKLKDGWSKSSISPWLVSNIVELNISEPRNVISFGGLKELLRICPNIRNLQARKCFRYNRFEVDSEGRNEQGQLNDFLRKKSFFANIHVD